MESNTDPLNTALAAHINASLKSDASPDSLLDYEQLANKLGLTKRGVECLVRSRKIPVIKLGHRTVRFSWTRVQQALAKREIHEV